MLIPTFSVGMVRLTMRMYLRVTSILFRIVFVAFVRLHLYASGSNIHYLECEIEVLVYQEKISAKFSQDHETNFVISSHFQFTEIFFLLRKSYV